MVTSCPKLGNFAGSGMIKFMTLVSFLSLLLHLLPDVQNFVAVAAVVVAVAVGDGGCLGVSEASWGADSAAGWPRIAQSGRKEISLHRGIIFN